MYFGTMKNSSLQRAPWFLLSAVALLSLLLGFALSHWQSQGQNPSQSSDAKNFPQGQSAPGGGKPKGPPVAVEVQIVSFQSRMDTLRLTGEIRAEALVDLRTEMPGRLIFAAPEGQKVQKGQIIARLDDAEQRALADKAKARVQYLAAQVKRARELETRGGTSASERESLEAEWAVAKADLDLSQAALRKMRIEAPFAGQLGLRETDPGAWVNTGTRVFRLQSNQALKVDFTVPREASHTLRAGQKVLLNSEGQNALAQIEALEPWVDSLARQRKVRAKLLASANFLAGRLVEVALPLGGSSSENSGIWLPAEAVTLDQKGANVFVIQGGVAMPKVVQTARRTPVEVEIVGGLQAGDSVVVAGSMLLRPKSEVKVKAVRGQDAERPPVDRKTVSSPVPPQQKAPSQPEKSL